MTTNIGIVILAYVGLMMLTTFAMTKWTEFMNRKVYSKYGNWQYFDIHVGKQWIAVTLVVVATFVWPVSMPILGTRILIRYWKARRQWLNEVKEIKLYDELMEIVLNKDAS